jgi:hypothetical protein
MPDLRACHAVSRPGRATLPGMSHKPWVPDPTEDAHAPRGARDPLTTVPSRSACSTDPDVDAFCPACTPAWSGDRWVHDGACIARKSARP